MGPNAVLKPIEITLDDRELRSGLDRALAAALGRAPGIARLAVGDVHIGPRCIVERKVTRDFAASLLERRLDQQLAALAGAGPGVRTLLIVEGDFSPEVLAGLDPRAVRAALLAVQLDWQIPVIRTRSLEDTAQWIAALAEREAGHAESPLPITLEPARAPQSPASANPGRRAAAPDPRAYQLRALQRIPGLGASKARALLDHFGSIQALRAAPPEALRAVPGIGPELAGAIRRALS